MKYTYPMTEMYEMSERDKIRQKQMEKNLADRYRLENHPSYKYDGTNYCVDFGKKTD